MRVFIALIAAMALLNAGAAQATAPHLIVQYVGTTPTSLAAGGAMPAWGSTPLEIGDKFPGIMVTACQADPGSFENNWYYADPYMRARFSTEYIAHDTYDYVHLAALFECMAKNDGNGVIALLVVAAFGKQLMTDFWMPWMTGGARELYGANVDKVTALPQSHWWVLNGGKLPNQPGTTAHPLPSDGYMGDLYVYDVLMDTYFSTEDYGTPPSISVVANTTGRYIHTTLHAVRKDDVVDRVILLAALVTIAQGILAIADSPSTEALNNWLEGWLGDQLGLPPLPSVIIPDPNEPFPDTWGLPWDGNWVNDLNCVGYATTCD